MSDTLIEFLTAFIPAIAAFLGVYIANRKAQAIMEYRLQELEKKVDKHNNVIERTYELEKQNAAQDERIKTLFTEMSDVKGQLNN